MYDDLLLVCCVVVKSSIYYCVTSRVVYGSVRPSVLVTYCSFYGVNLRVGARQHILLSCMKVNQGSCLTWVLDFKKTTPLLTWYKASYHFVSIYFFTRVLVVGSLSFWKSFVTDHHHIGCLICLSFLNSFCVANGNKLHIPKRCWDFFDFVTHSKCALDQCIKWDSTSPL